jgi:CBS domain-containing protein
MSRHPIHRTCVSALLGTPVTDAQGRMRGRVRELMLVPAQNPNHIAAIIYRNKEGQFAVPVHDLILTPAGTLELRDEADPQVLMPNEHSLLLERDLLDQQIIDVHGRKVVRVNDVDLEWELADVGVLQLRVDEVGVGTRSAVRRLLKGLPQATIDVVAKRFAARGIPWEFVNLIETDPARRVRLKIEHERLSQMHPSDIADILEELAPAEREAVFTSLDEEVAAETLEEVDPKLQKALIEGLDSERVAGIVEEMDPGAAADLLAELTEEKSEAILEEMDPDERQEVEELLEFPENSAAGRMTTDCVHVLVTATVIDTVEALRSFEGDTESVTEIYLLDEKDVLHGVVPLSRLVLARPETKVAVLTEPHFISCMVDANLDKVVELFDKYNLRALPVVDKEKRLTGVVQAEQVIAVLREKL